MSLNGKENDFIPSVLYDQIVKLMPIVSVEALIVIDGALLFLRRKNHPAMGSGGLLGAGYGRENLLRKHYIVKSKKNWVLK